MKHFYQFPLTLFVVFILSGCASSHNLRTDGFNSLGGGFAESELRPGLYELRASGNLSPWPSLGAARATWKRRADQLCGENAYASLVTALDAGYRGESTYYNLNSLPLQKFNTTMNGYILCDRSGWSVEQAVQFLIERHEQAAKDLAEGHQAELKRLGGSDCTDSKVSADVNFHRGKELFALSQYGPAMQCFVRAQDQAHEGEIFRESCASIATMYELGWGVSKDFEAAKVWLKKAGL